MAAQPLTPRAGAATSARAALRPYLSLLARGTARATLVVAIPSVQTPSPQSWDNLANLGTWDYVAGLYTSWDNLYANRQQPPSPIPPVPGPQAYITPDLAGLSLAGAYQAGRAAGFKNFQIVAYRETYMINPDFAYFLEIAPAVGYVAQTATPGSGGDTSDVPNGSFYTTQVTVGVPDQVPDPGSTVATNGVLCFVFQVADDFPEPNDVTNFMTDGDSPGTGTMVWWEYTFTANNVPPTLQESMNLYNGPPLAPVDLTTVEWPLIAQNPLSIFTVPPPLAPTDLLSEVPPFERQSYEIIAVLRVVANEMARVAAGQEALTQQWFPASADVLLARFEAMLGLPVQPANQPLTVRRGIVLAYMQRLRLEGTGLDWIASMDSLAGSAWDYQEHDPADPSSPDAYTINVNIPQVFASVGWTFVRDITPAHIVINEGYTGGWLLGVSDLWSEGPYDNNTVDDVL